MIAAASQGVVVFRRPVRICLRSYQDDRSPDSVGIARREIPTPERSHTYAGMFMIPRKIRNATPVTFSPSHNIRPEEGSCPHSSYNFA